MAADIYTLARPYAEAVFDMAGDDEARGQWSNALAALAAIVDNDDVAAIFSSTDMGGILPAWTSPF